MSDNPKKRKESIKINWGWDSPENRNGKASRKTKSTAKKTFKKIGLKGLLIVLLFLVVGLGLGASVTYFLTKDDCFDIVGSDDITLMLNEGYSDEGVKAISFGRDISSNVIIDTNMTRDENGVFYAKENEIGTYYIIYKFDDIKYGKIFTVERIRLITFVEAQEDPRDDSVVGGN